jgi:hypothetical protein
MASRRGGLRAPSGGCSKARAARGQLRLHGTACGRGHPWIGPIGVPWRSPRKLRPVISREDGAGRARPRSARRARGRGCRGRALQGPRRAARRVAAVLSRVPDAQLTSSSATAMTARLKSRLAWHHPSVIFTGFVSDAVLETLYAAAAFAMPSATRARPHYLEAWLMAFRASAPCADAATEVTTTAPRNIWSISPMPATGGPDRPCSPTRPRLEMGARGLARWQRRFTYDQFRDASCRWCSRRSAAGSPRPGAWCQPRDGAVRPRRRLVLQWVAIWFIAAAFVCAVGEPTKAWAY